MTGKYNYNPIFKLLIDKRMTKRELCERSGVSMSCLTRMKHGNPVSIDVLSKISDTLGCTVSELYEKEIL